MITRQFVAIIEEAGPGIDWSQRYQLLVEARKLTARLSPGPRAEWLRAAECLVLVRLNRPSEVFWGQRFRVTRGSDGLVLAHGRIIDPSPETEKKDWAAAPWLRMLAGQRQEMLLALGRRLGIRGVREKDVSEFSGLDSATLLSLLEAMELKKQARILSFRPLFFISQESLDFLVNQVEAFLKRYHQKHPESLGIAEEKLRKRFRIPRLVLQLALARLRKARKVISQEGEQISLVAHEIPLEPEEEKILAALEEWCYRGELRRISFEEIRQRFRVSATTLNKLLAHLVAKKKIFQGEDGFYLHAHWLEEIIRRLRGLGKREITIAEFKALTGLTRKYAIPLLELLDELGITRRKGSVREIL